MKVLITGGSGFVGRHLSDELLRHGHTVSLTALEGGVCLTPTGHRIDVLPCDVRDRSRVHDIVSSLDPDAIVHLAGIAHVVKAGDERETMSSVTFLGTQNICTAVSKLKKNVAVLMSSSAFVYGDRYSGEFYVNEKTPTNPTTPYGHIKLAAEHLLAAFEGESLSPYIVRPFNHIGAGQDSSFVCPALAKRILATHDGGTIEVGNLRAKRDFSDVRDIAQAYRLILEQKPKERFFVLGSGKAQSINTVFELLCTHAKKRIQTKVNPELLRSHDDASIAADSSLAQSILGWKCRYSLSESLKEVLDDVQKSS